MLPLLLLVPGLFTLVTPVYGSQRLETETARLVVPRASQRDGHRPVHGIEVDGSALFIELVTATGWALVPATLHVITHGSHPGAVRWTVPLPLRSGWAPERDSGSGRMVARASFTRGWGRART